jgi:invasion protein IalB
MVNIDGQARSIFSHVLLWGLILRRDFSSKRQKWALPGAPQRCGASFLLKPAFLFAFLSLSSSLVFAQTPVPTTASPGTAPAVAAPSGLSSAAPVITRFDDWELICDAAPPKADAPASATPVPTPAPHAACKVMQKLAAKDTGETVFLVSVLPAAKPGEFVTIISAPLGGYLVPGMELHIDKQKPVRVLFETCNSGGCHGGFALVGKIKDALSSGKQAQVRIWTTKSKPVDVNVSLNGFGRAVKALEEASK